MDVQSGPQRRQEPKRRGRARAPDSPMPGEGMGEGGCLFDEIGNLVEPTERPYMDVPAGPQRGMDAEAWRPEWPGPTENSRSVGRPNRCGWRAFCRYLELAARL
jgi:hypothetical protein